MADSVTTEFTKMGQYPSGGQFVNVSGAPSPNTIRVKKGGGGTGMLEAATAKHRANIHERLGAKLHPTATLYEANAAEASAVGRQTYRVPSRVGLGDFYTKRKYGQVMQ